MTQNSSKNMRDNPLFMRNNYAGSGRWNIPQVKKQEIDIDNISLIACSDTKSHDKAENKQNGVHFFVDDYPQRNNFGIRPLHKITKEEYQLYKKYFKGVPKIDKW